jgi:ribosomal protein S20
MGVRTAIKANSTTLQNKLAQQKLDELDKVIKEIQTTVNEKAVLQSNGNDTRIKQLVEQYYENLQNQVNQLYQQDQLSDITPQIQLAAQNVEAATNYLIQIQSELNKLNNYQIIERNY